MSSRFWRAALAVLALSFAAPVAFAQQASQPAPSQAAGPMLVLVVDAQHVVNESKAGKSIRQQFDTQRQAFSKEVSAAEASLRSQQQEIERQRSILSPDAFAAKAREFDKKVADMRRGWEQKRETLQYSLNIALAQIERNILEIVSQIALERKASLVLQKQHVVIVDKTYDITPETMARLDQKLPTLAFNLVQPPAREGDSGNKPTSGQGQQSAPKAAPKASPTQQKGDTQKKQ
ncbi:MAG: OmpH family outer membrane protein [Rhodospirillales bacterium]|nr:OmpH family outer membrane protein [Rhodospirillales bacterium]